MIIVEWKWNQFKDEWRTYQAKVEDKETADVLMEQLTFNIKNHFAYKISAYESLILKLMDKPYCVKSSDEDFGSQNTEEIEGETNGKPNNSETKT